MEQPAAVAPPADVPVTTSRFRLRRATPWLLLAVVVIAVDQGTKALVRATLDLYEAWPPGWEIIRLQHIENTGAAFGILQGAGTFLVVAAFVLIAGITAFLLTLPSHGRLYHVALTLILGGAIGNLIDRVRLGAVTDFIDPTHYPAFNLADSSIFCGVALLVFLAFRDGDEGPFKDAP
ncbi:MAG: signal peptidase II [Dehalococcoidia bacterium]|nr:MAG: signal peptidase II [Dehalococcoidia bacterium]